MNKESKFNANEKAVIYAIAVTAGILVTVLMMLLMAVVSAAADFGEATASPISSICAAVGSFTASFVCSKRIGSGGLLNGLICGAAMFIIILLISLAADHSGFSLITLFHLTIVVLAALIGGIAGVNAGNKRKIV